ncbi:MaoC family dehydratase [Streptomonospora litoralis]|uniref:Bifunctional protein PaaZ n=1 Tax=Streptomonospora litoralis TaxID=2498135 RepID=A0A4P6PZ66_9ACTN|nr:MaoC family dehydratase [Streptomonospora litoralis]QBI53606.1 Bifunctional protein PaaZ [Streptomonospora litoralis]
MGAQSGGRTEAVPFHERFLEDYTVGETVDCGTIAVTEDEIAEFAGRFDPQSFHVDPHAAAEGPFGGLIASGWHTAALMMRLYVDRYLSAKASLGGPGVDELRWTEPVRPGDTLALRAEVLEVRPSAAKPERGLLRTRVELANQHGRTVFTAVVLNLLRTRPR